MNEPALTRCPSANTGFSAEKASQGRVGARPFILLQGDRLVGDRRRSPCRQPSSRWPRARSPASNRPAALRCGGSLLRPRRVFILALTRGPVPLRNDLRRLEHAHVEVVTVLDEPGVLGAVTVHLVVLNQRNGFKAAANGDAHAVATISFAAVAMAMSPEAHCRSSDMPATLVGGPRAGALVARRCRPAIPAGSPRPSRRRRSSPGSTDAAATRSRSHGRRASEPACR